MIIAIDFDGTCVTHRYPYVGDDIGAVPVLRELVSKGHNLILNTMRCNDHDSGNYSLNEAVNWFKSNKLPLYGVNENPYQHSWTKSPKIYADYYIDDAALGCPLSNEFDKNRKHVDWIEMRKLLQMNGLL